MCLRLCDRNVKPLNAMKVRANFGDKNCLQSCLSTCPSRLPNSMILMLIISIADDVPELVDNANFEDASKK